MLTDAVTGESVPLFVENLLRGEKPRGEWMCGAELELFGYDRARGLARIDALGLRIDFRAGERIHTENSYKYSLDELSALAADTGFARARTWLDPAERFSSNLFVARNAEL